MTLFEQPPLQMQQSSVKRGVLVALVCNTTRGHNTRARSDEVRKLWLTACEGARFDPPTARQPQPSERQDEPTRISAP